MNESFAITALLGLSMGSFLNVCVYRIPRNISVISPRSFCPHCNRQLQWYELVPVGSYLFARGKCRKCSGRISVTYLVNEVIVALLFIILFYRYGMSTEFALAAAFSCLMLAVAIIDWQYLAVPNVVVVSGFVIGIVVKLSFGDASIIRDAVAAMLAFVTLFTVRFSGNAYFKKETMGWGDVKLAGLIGFFIGFQFFLGSLWLASAAGAMFGFVRQQGVKNPEEEKIPFGSFLAFASMAAMFSRDAINQLFERWSTLLQ